jgi:hypothetical protein
VNLHAIASAAVGIVNPMTPAELWQSTGYAVDPDGDGTQVPAYRISKMNVQVQALSNDELRRLDGLNIQGNKSAVYLSGNWNGIVRVGSQGGDLIKFGGQTWLATVVLENWPTWTKLAVTLQNET